MSPQIHTAKFDTSSFRPRQKKGIRGFHCLLAGWVTRSEIADWIFDTALEIHTSTCLAVTRFQVQFFWHEVSQRHQAESMKYTAMDTVKWFISINSTYVCSKSPKTICSRDCYSNDSSAANAPCATYRNRDSFDLSA